MKIIHIITSASNGGAQSVLHTLLRGWNDPADSHLVVSLMAEGETQSQLQSSGFDILQLDWRPRRLNLSGFRRLRRILLQVQPDLIQTWLYHADLVGSLAALLSGHRPIVWALHHSLQDWPALRPSTRVVVRLLALLSRVVPARIACCSESTRQTHVAAGYAAHRMVVIPNGVDTERFRPDPTARSNVLRELHLPPTTRLIGMFARAHPHKDHLTFLRAASLAQADPRLHFVLAGSGVDKSNERLHNAVEAMGLSRRLHLLGSRADMPQLMAAMDVVTLSSRVEALPVTLEEAMSCGKPCVATDVGECPALLEGSGIIVPPGEAAALADGWQRVLALPLDDLDRLGRAARQRIKDSHSAAEMVDRYKGLYRGLVGGAGGEARGEHS